MVLARFERPVTDAAGNLIPNVTVSVRKESAGAPKAALKSDRDGAVGIDNPYLFVDGVIAFHVLGGVYRIDITAAGGFSQTFRYVGIGTGSEVDANTQLQPGYLMQWEMENAPPPSAGCIRSDNDVLGSATKLYVSKSNSAGSDLGARLLALEPGGKANKNRFALTAGDGTQVSWAVASVTDHTGYVELGVTGHSGEAALTAGLVNMQLLISGADGFVPGVSMVFSTTTAAADPGAGKFRLNHATHSSATALYIDNVEALAGADITPLVDSWDDTGGAALRGQLLIASKTNPAIFRLYNVTGSVVNSTGYRTVTIAYVVGNGALADLDGCVIGFSSAGAPGANGANGADGYSPGYRLTMDTTVTDSDPGAGKVRFNNATFASITQIYVDNTDAGAASITAWLDGLDDVSNANARAYLRFQKATDPAVYAEFAVIGAVVDGTGYRKIPVSPIAGAIPANATVLVATASKSGLDGSAGTPDIDRRNALMGLADVAKNSGSYRRYLDTIVCGFKSSGDADATSSVGSVDTSAGAWKPGTSSPSNQIVAHSGSNTSASGTISADTNNSTAYNVVDGSDLVTPAYWISTGAASGKLTYQFGSGKRIASYRVTAGIPSFPRYPTDWTLKASNAGTFTGEEVTLDTRSGQAFSTQEERSFTISSPGTYTYYRLDVTNCASGANLSIIEWKLLDEGSPNNATLITPYQTADAARTKARGTFEIDPVDAITLGTHWTVEYTCNGGTNWTAASTYTNCGKGQAGRTIVETEEVSCTSGTSFAARVKNLSNKNVHVYKAAVKAAA